MLYLLAQNTWIDVADNAITTFFWVVFMLFLVVCSAAVPPDSKKDKSE